VLASHPPIESLSGDVVDPPPFHLHCRPEGEAAVPQPHPERLGRDPHPGGGLRNWHPRIVARHATTPSKKILITSSLERSRIWAKRCTSPTVNLFPDVSLSLRYSVARSIPSSSATSCTVTPFSTMRPRSRRTLIISTPPCRIRCNIIITNWQSLVNPFFA